MPDLTIPDPSDDGKSEMSIALRALAPSVHGVAAMRMRNAADLIDEMLAALKTIARLYGPADDPCDDLGPNASYDALDATDAAIAKAEGRE